MENLGRTLLLPLLLSATITLFASSGAKDRSGSGLVETQVGPIPIFTVVSLKQAGPKPRPSILKPFPAGPDTAEDTAIFAMETGTVQILRSHVADGSGPFQVTDVIKVEGEPRGQFASTITIPVSALEGATVRLLEPETPSSSLTIRSEGKPQGWRQGMCSGFLISGSDFVMSFRWLAPARGILVIEGEPKKGSHRLRMTAEGDSGILTNGTVSWTVIYSQQ